MDDGRSGAVENEKGKHYVAMPMSWEARNNEDMNKGMGYNNMADLANSAHPPTKMEGGKRNVQLSPQMPGEDKFNYNANR
jgi:hypothetical protein